MANLSLPAIAREERHQYRTALLVNKVFKQEGYDNNFMTDLGLFYATQITLNDELFTRYSPDLADKILSAYGNRGHGRVVLDLKGRLVGQTGLVKLSINKIEKSEDFGGQPAGGKKENRGLKFEKEIYERFRECIQGKKCEGQYADAAMYILEKCAKDVGSPVIDIDPEGDKNTPRPLHATYPFIMPAIPIGHGKLLTDITLIHTNRAKSFLSLKYTSTLSFVNAGIKVRHLLSIQIQNGKIITPAGKALLKVLGIDNELFCNVFKDRRSGTWWRTKDNSGKDKNVVLLEEEKKNTNPKGSRPWVVNIQNKIDKEPFEKLISTAIGANYYMVHGLPPKNVWFWNMTKALNLRAKRPIGPMWLYYGGKQGSGKRIDIEFSNSYFDFKLNIRNKQGGLYPSHLMLDYTSKSAIGKQQIN